MRPLNAVLLITSLISMAVPISFANAKTMEKDIAHGRNIAAYGPDKTDSETIKWNYSPPSKVWEIEQFRVKGYYQWYKEYTPTGGGAVVGDMTNHTTWFHTQPGQSNGAEHFNYYLGRDTTSFTYTVSVWQNSAPNDFFWIGPVDVSVLISDVPEPDLWVLMVSGFGLIGCSIRRTVKANACQNFE